MTDVTNVQQTPDAVAGQATVSLLDQAVSATKQTERSQAEKLLKVMTDEALSGTITWDKNLLASLNKAIEGIDKKMSAQLAEIMHAEEFKKLEGSWRGLNHLVMNTETSSSLKVRVLNASKRELFKDIDKAVEFDQSQVFKKLYEAEYGTPGGEPYSVLIGDYHFGNHPEDIDLLTGISQVSAASFAPFISAAGLELFGFDDWQDLAKPRDLEKLFNTVEYTKWNEFRDSDESCFVNLVMPRTLARLPYGSKTKTIDEFNFEEAPIDNKGRSLPLAQNDYCWTNAAYIMGTNITRAIAAHGWATGIRGAEGGGKVEGLPAYNFISDDGETDMQCPTEIGITDRREAELSRLGLLPLCHYKNTNYAVFFGAQSVQRAKKYDEPAANANAEISARMPYVLATSRFAHYLKVMARDKIGSFMQVEQLESWLNRWIKKYINSNPNASQDMKLKYPLAEAKVEVKQIPGKPGAYNAIAWLKPWLQMEELNASLRLVAEIPQIGGGEEEGGEGGE